MRKTANPKDDDQLKAFRKAARNLGCHYNEERFQDALRMMAKAKPLKRLKRRTDQRGK
jgi:hypothetical protein